MRLPAFLLPASLFAALLAGPLLTAPVAAIAPAPADALSAEDRQVLELAQRLRAVDADVMLDDAGKWQCSLSGTSGTKRVDDRLCATATRCARTFKGREDKVQQCVAENRSAILEQFRHRLQKTGGAA